jgi:hypothetical protein
MLLTMLVVQIPLSIDCHVFFQYHAFVLFALHTYFILKFKFAHLIPRHRRRWGHTGWATTTALPLNSGRPVNETSNLHLMRPIYNSAQRGPSNLRLVRPIYNSAQRGTSNLRLMRPIYNSAQCGSSNLCLMRPICNSAQRRPSNSHLMRPIYNCTTGDVKLVPHEANI